MEQMLNLSKLMMPRLSPKYIERKHLEDLFTANSYKKITILRTPAGYGKTTLLSAYLRKINVPVAWITLDEGDNDLILFWTYFVKAISDSYQLLPSSMNLSLSQLSNQSILKIGLFQLIEELTLYHEPVKIVLDDYHFIQDEKIHDFLIQLVEYLPENVHIYLTSRTAVPFPLAKWCVRQWVQELDLTHLKFNRQDTKSYLLLTTNRPFNDSHIQSIFDKTEGWVSGLLLTTLASENEPMLLDKSEAYTTDFLWQEIIYKQPLAIQDFLLKTSLLQELDPEICDELTGRTDSAILLEKLERDGLFILKLQSTSLAYRYHHLFSNALQDELAKRFDADVIAGIVKKAAFIYFAKGELFTGVELAMKYKLYEVATKWIDEHLLTILSSKQTGTFIRWLRVLREEDLPLSYEVLIAGFQNAISSLQFDLAQELMDELEELHREKQWMDNPQYADLTNLFIRTKAYFLVGQGDKLPEVFALLQTQLFKNSISSNRINPDISYNNYETNLLRMGLASKGKLVSKKEALEVIQLFRHTELRMLVVSTYIFAVGTAMFYELNEITEAEKELAIVLEKGHQTETPDLYVPMYLLKAKMYLMQGQPLSALAMLQQVEEKVSEKHWKNALKIMQARCHLLNGEMERAQFLLDVTKSHQPFWRLTYARYLLQSGLNEEALHTIIQVKTEAEQEEQLATIIEASVLEVICHSEMNNHSYAEKSLHAAFQLAAQYGYIRTFLDEKKIIPIIQRYLKNPSYVETQDPELQTYLAVLKQHLPIVHVDKQEKIALTPREKDIFKLIIAGAKNREIASKLNLSEGTVRVYITALYSKIGVTSRVQAILYGQLNPTIFR